jgi:hypothetical protein
MHTRTKALLGTTTLVLIAAPLALGAGEGAPLDGGARNPSPNASIEYVRETQIIADNQTYGTRQSNKSTNGGGAIYGCRSLPGGTAANNEPCIRSNNLNTGLAFEFETNGTIAGTISAKPGDGSKPFITNATGVATGLNADRVDGKHVTDIVKDAAIATQALNPLALVKADGVAERSRGVETNGVSRSVAGNYDVKFTGDLSTCALAATITGTDPGQVAVTPVVAADKKTTTVDVRTFDGSGAVADRGFHLHANC